MFGERLSGLLNQTLSDLWARSVAFAPNVLAMLLILAAGVIVAGVVRVGVRFLLSVAGGDALASRLGVQAMLKRAGVTRPPSTVIALVLAWTTLGVFVVGAIGALDPTIAADLATRALVFLPQIFVAVSLLILGMLASTFLHRSVLIAAVNAGIPSARFLAAAARTAAMAVALALALEHLGLGRQIIVTAFAIVFGGAVFALSLALGLGGRDLAREALERWLRRPPTDAEQDDPRRHL